MSDVPQGAGWWQASDGRWYPPEQQPAFGSGPGHPYGAPPMRRTNSNAITSLVLGILAIVMCGFVTGIPAVIIGNRARREIDDSAGTEEGRGMATAGLVMGWISIAFVVLALLVFLFIALAAAA